MVVKNKVQHSLQRYQVLTEEQRMLDVMVDGELELLYSEFVELEVHLG